MGGFLKSLPMKKNLKRIQKYLDKIDPAVSGSNGHNQTFKVACLLIHRFGLSDIDAWPLLKTYSERCSPPWSDKDLKHKLASARSTAKK